MSTLLRLSLCSAFLLFSTALPAQNAPSSPEKEDLGPTPEQGVQLWRTVVIYSGDMMINAYVGLAHADKGLQEGHNQEDIKRLVTVEQAMLKRIEKESNRLRTTLASEKDLCFILDGIQDGVTLVKAQAEALSEVINGKSRTEAGLDAKRQAARVHILKMVGKEDSKIIP